MRPNYGDAFGRPFLSFSFWSFIPGHLPPSDHFPSFHVETLIYFILYCLFFLVFLSQALFAPVRAARDVLGELLALSADARKGSQGASTASRHGDPEASLGLLPEDCARACLQAIPQVMTGGVDHSPPPSPANPRRPYPRRYPRVELVRLPELRF